MISKNIMLIFLFFFLLLSETIASSRRYKINCIEAHRKISKRRNYPAFIEDIKSECAVRFFYSFINGF